MQGQAPRKGQHLSGQPARRAYGEETGRDIASDLAPGGAASHADVCRESSPLESAETEGPASEEGTSLNVPQREKVQLPWAPVPAPMGSNPDQGSLPWVKEHGAHSSPSPRLATVEGKEREGALLQSGKMGDTPKGLELEVSATGQLQTAKPKSGVGT